MSKTVTVEPYVQFLTQLVSLNIAGVAAVVAFIQTESGKHFNFILLVITFVLLMVSILAGLVALWMGNNLIGRAPEQINNKVFKISYAISLLGSGLGILIFLVGITITLVAVRNATDSRQADSNIQTRTILVLPDRNSDLRYLDKSIKLEDYDVVLMPPKMNRCLEKTF